MEEAEAGDIQENEGAFFWEYLPYKEIINIEAGDIQENEGAFFWEYLGS